MKRTKFKLKMIVGMMNRRVSAGWIPLDESFIVTASDGGWRQVGLGRSGGQWKFVDLH